jgi:hypothetical protein
VLLDPDLCPELDDDPWEGWGELRSELVADHIAATLNSIFGSLNGTKVPFTTMKDRELQADHEAIAHELMIVAGFDADSPLTVTVNSADRRDRRLVFLIVLIAQGVVPNSIEVRRVAQWWMMLILLHGYRPVGCGPWLSAAWAILDKTYPGSLFADACYLAWEFLADRYRRLEGGPKSEPTDLYWNRQLTYVEFTRFVHQRWGRVIGGRDYFARLTRNMLAQALFYSSWIVDHDARLSELPIVVEDATDDVDWIRVHDMWAAYDSKNVPATCINLKKRKIPIEAPRREVVENWLHTARVKLKPVDTLDPWARRLTIAVLRQHIPESHKELRDQLGGDGYETGLVDDISAADFLKQMLLGRARPVDTDLHDDDPLHLGDDGYIDPDTGGLDMDDIEPLDLWGDENDWNEIRQDLPRAAQPSAFQRCNEFFGIQPDTARSIAHALRSLMDQIVESAGHGFGKPEGDPKTYAIKRPALWREVRESLD